MVNPGGDAGKMLIPTLKGKNQEGCDVLATPNEEKSTLLACTLFPDPPTMSAVPTNFAYPEPAEN